jgi:cytoskeletal protein RodZ
MRGYDYASAHNISTFTGILVGRRYKPGQKYIQLVFKTAEGLRLSLTRDLQTVRQLTMGQTYQIEGNEYIQGQKSFIYEPKASLVQPRAKSLKKRKIVIASVILLVIGGSASAMSLTKHGPVNHAQNSDTKTEGKQTSETSNTSSTSPPQTAQDQSSQPSTTPQTNSATSTKKTTTAKTNNTSPANAAQTPPSDNSAPVNGGDQSVNPPPPVEPNPAPAPPPEPPTPSDPVNPDPTNTSP